MSNSNSSFTIKLQAMLDKIKSLANIKADIKAIEPKLPKIKIKGTLDKAATNKELKAKLKDVKPKVKVEADTTQAEKKIKKIGKQKTEAIIRAKADNSQVVSDIKEAQKETKTLWERFIGGVAGINLIQMGIQKIVQSIHQAIVNIKELDAIKTNIQMVSGASDSKVNGMMSSYNSMAKDLSSTTKDVAEAANEFLRMGESIAHTNELIKSSQILSKVGMIDSADAASYLISSLKGYKVAAEDSLDIVSKLTSVDLEAAVSAGGLSEALSKCANIANNSGVSMDRLIGYTATVGETTQKSMSEVGNSFQSLLSRMNNIKIGRFIDDETGESLSDTEAVLNKLGIQLRDTENTYRDFDDVLDDVGSRWKDFTKVEQNAISVAIAGTRQRENFEALMNNWANALKYSETAVNSAGSALERYGVYQDSIEAKTNELTAAMESLSTNTISEELYSGIIVATTNVVEFIDKANLLKGTLAGLVTMGVSKTFVSIATSIISASKSTAQLTAAMKLFDNGRSADNLKDIGTACKGLNNNQLKLILSTKGLKTQQRLAILEGMGLEEQERKQMLITLGFAAAEDKATFSTFSLKGAWNSLKVAMATNPIGAIVSIVSVAVMIFSGFNQAIEESRQKARDLGEELKSTKADIDSYKTKIEDLYKTINDSNSSISDVTEARKNLMTIQDELIDKYGAEEKVIQNVTDAINGQADALDKLTQNKWQEIKNEFNDTGFWEGIGNGLSGYSNKIERMVAEMEHANVSLSGLPAEHVYITLNGVGDYSDEYESSANNELIKALMNAGYEYDLYSTSIKLHGGLQTVYSDILKIQKIAEEYDAPENFLKSLTQEANKAKETLDDYGEMWDAYVLRDVIFENEELAQSWKDVNEAYADYRKAFESGDKEAQNSAIDGFSQSLDNVLDNSDVADSVKEYFRNMYPALANEVGKWEFRYKILPDLDIHALKGKTQADILEMLQVDGSQYGEDTFNSLLRMASDYGILIGEDSEKINQLLDLLAEWEILQENIADMDIPESAASFSDIFTSSADSLDKFQSSVKSAADAYTTLLTGNFSSSELLDSIQAINKAASDMGESIDWESISTSDNPLQAIQDAIESVSKTYADSVLSGAGIDADSKFGQMLANIVQESYKSESALSSLNTQVDSLQSAYNNLTDIVTAYNETGYITFDQLQTLLAMEPQYLSCLVDENGQLQLNQESMLALANQRLNDAEAQAVQQAITELGQLALQDEKTAVEENAQAFSNAVNDLAAYNEELAGTIGEASIASSVIRDLNAAISGAESQGASDVQIGTVLDNLNTKLQLIRNTRLNLGKSMGNIVGGKTSPSASSSAKSEFEETVDFFKQRVEVLDDALSHLDTTLDNVAGSFGKNSLIDAELGINEEKFNNYTDALSMYTQKANEAFSKIPADIASRVKDGAVALTDFIGDSNKDVAEAIKEYESWADKVADCKQELAELQKEIRQLELEKFNNIMDDFENQFNLRGDSKDLISKQIALFKEAGELIGESFYTAQIDQSQKQLALLENEKAQLVNQMSSAISSGKIQSGTEEWLEMVNALNSVDGSILDCKKSIEEFDNAIQNLHWEIFDRVQDSFKNISDEISNLVGVMDDSDVATKDNQWTKEGLTQLGLYAQQYELATYQVSQYADEIDKLNADYLNGKYSATEYADKLADLNSAQWDAVNAAESAKDSIMDLNKARVDIVVKGIQEEIDAYKELTDSKIKALDAEKDLHEYQNTIAEKSKNISKIEKQLAAMQNDNTAATIAKRKQLEEQLAEARTDLDETQYDHSVEAQREALNQQYQDYEDARNKEIEDLEETLTDRENMIASSMESVKQNTQVVANQITDIANQHGIKVSAALTNSWQSGENAIASYGEVLSQNTSVFIGNIMGVENEVWNLQAQANTTADSLAWMFSTRADNLVNELNTSYFAEANLASMTNALQQSLVNTLERGYDVSSIVNSLNAVTDAANKAKAATSSIGNSNAGLTYTSFNNSDANRKYSVKDENNKSLFTGNLSQCQAWVSAHNYGFGSIVGDNINVIDNNKKNVYTSVSAKAPLKKYASGAKNIEEDQLAITNEAGQELVYHTSDGSILTPLRPGDKVFENEAVNRLWQLGHGIIPPDMTKNLAIPTVLPNVNNNNNAVNIHYDSMFRIEGDVVDADRITRRMEETACKIADRQIDKNWREFSKELRYGGSASSMYARK